MNALPRREATGRNPRVAGRDVRPDIVASRLCVAWRESQVITHAPGYVCCAKDGSQSNNGMHPTAGTLLVIYLQGGRRGG